MFKIIDCYFELCSKILNSFEPVSAIWQQYLSIDCQKFFVSNNRPFTVVPVFLNCNHWSLIIIDYCQSKIHLIDPKDDPSNLSQLEKFAKSLQSKQNPFEHYTFSTPMHTIQENDWECGFFIMIVFFHAHV